MPNRPKPPAKPKLTLAELQQESERLRQKSLELAEQAQQLRENIDALRKKK